jgi:hypothetical protein
MDNHHPLKDPPKFTNIAILGLKMYHLATLMCTDKNVINFYWPFLPLHAANRCLIIFLLIVLLDDVWIRSRPHDEAAADSGRGRFFGRDGHSGLVTRQMH